MLIINRYILLLWVKNTVVTFGLLFVVFQLVDGLSLLAQLQASGFQPKLVWVILWVSSWRVSGQIADFAVGLGTLLTMASLNHNREWALLLCSGYQPKKLAGVLGGASLLFGTLYVVAVQPVLAPYAAVEEQIRDSVLTRGEYTWEQSGDNVWLRHEDFRADSWIHVLNWQAEEKTLEGVTIYEVTKPQASVVVSRCDRVDYAAGAYSCSAGGIRIDQWDVETQLLPAKALWFISYPVVIGERARLGQNAAAHWAAFLSIGFKPVIWALICGFAVRLGSQPALRHAGLTPMPLLAVALSGSYLLQQLLKAQIETGTLSPLVAGPIYFILVWIVFRSNQKHLE